MLRSGIAGTFVLLVGLGMTSPVLAQDVCGDAADNDSDGLADEGCNPTAVTGQCISPYSCAAVGAVSPKTGNLVFRRPPDLAPVVPFGPDMAFQRFYTSQYNPGYFPGGVADYTHPLGFRWGHSYMSWLKKTGSSVVVHLRTGNDVRFTYGYTSGSYDYYNPQVGYAFEYLRQNVSTARWELKFMSGEVHAFNFTGSVGKLDEIWDTLATPNKVTITYNTDGQVDRVTSAGGAKHLQFRYLATSTKILKFVDLYADAALRVTIEFFYNSTNETLQEVRAAGDPLEYYTSAGGYLTSAYYGYPGTGFKYVSGSPGKVAQVLTAEGQVGYAYDVNCDTANSRHVFYNRSEDTACDTDAQCGSNRFCGGKTGPGSTGSCYEVRRCEKFSTINEDLVTDVTAETRVSGTPTACPSCVGIKHYEWETTFTLNLLGTAKASASGGGLVKTSMLYLSNKRLRVRTESDDDYNPLNISPPQARTTYVFYNDATFPGLVTEARRKSELGAGACDLSTDTGCRRSIVTYTNGLPDLVQQKGFTYNSVGSPVNYNFTTDHDYDSKGRIIKITGPRAGVNDNVEFTYYGSGNGLGTDYVSEIKSQRDDLSFLTDTYAEYEFWGAPKRKTDPNGKSICTTYDSALGEAETVRQVVNGNHTNCAAAPGNKDETTTYDRGGDRNIISTLQPRGNRTLNFFQGNQLFEERRYDAGDSDAATFMSHAPGPNWSVAKTTWGDFTSISSRVTREQSYTYFPDRRVKTIVNPVSPTYAKQVAYFNSGLLKEIVAEGTSGAATRFEADSLDRTSIVRRFSSAGSFDQWNVTPGVQLDAPTQMADPMGSSRSLNFVFDDLGRKVKSSSSSGGTTLMLHDEASNLISKIEAFGTAGQLTTSYSFDSLNRLTVVNSPSTECLSGSGAETQYSYDSLGSYSCPAGSTCDLLLGRLALVRRQLFCDGTYPDGRDDMYTFNSYSEGGRLEEHTIQSDSGQLARMTYSFDKNGNLVRTNYPAGSTSGAVYQYGSLAAPGDDDLVTALYRDSTPLSTGIKWNPYGPPSEYGQSNAYYDGSCASTPRVTKLDYNLAYRVNSIHTAAFGSPTNSLTRIDFAEDERGRYTQRDLSFTGPGEKDIFVAYDNLNRITCRDDAPILGGACPTGGAFVENMSYNPSGERTSLTLANSALGATTFTTTFAVDGSGNATDRIGSIAKSSGGTINFSWNSRGQRFVEDDSSYPGLEGRRMFIHDTEGNLQGVCGKYWSSAYEVRDYCQRQAYDDRGRLVFSAFVDVEWESLIDTKWYYYDQFDRLVSAVDYPASGGSSTYEYYYIGRRPVAYYHTNAPSGFVTRRYLQSDEQGRPYQAWSWPATSCVSGGRVWNTEQGLFGWDVVQTGPTVYQPLRLPGQVYDDRLEVVAVNPDGSRKLLRPGVAFETPAGSRRSRAYDAFTGTYLSVGNDENVGLLAKPSTALAADVANVLDSSSYNYANQNPLSKWALSNRFGLAGVGIEPIGLTPVEPKPVVVAKTLSECYETFEKDQEKCRKLPEGDKKGRARCWEGIMTDQAKCIEESSDRFDLGGRRGRFALIGGALLFGLLIVGSGGLILVL